LINDLTAAAQSKKPSPDAVSRLAKDLMTMLAGNDKLRAQPQKLAQWVHAVFNSSHLSAAQQQMIHDGVQKIFADTGVPMDEAANVISDLNTIATATQ
jgi:methyl-accepting chemotaxis protein